MRALDINNFIKAMIKEVKNHIQRNWQIYFVLAYPQAKIECNLYMKLPADFKIAKDNSRSHILLLKRNLCS